MNKNQHHKYINQNKEAYNAVASIFSSTREYIWDDLKGLEKYVKKGDKVLDLGCGNGRLLGLFEGMGIEYVGLDQSEKLIKIAKEKNPNTEFVQGEMTELPFEDDSFDAIYCIAVFCHLPLEFHVKALKEMKRVLKPGGHLVMTNWNAFNNWVQNKVELGKYTTEDQKNFIVPWRNGPGEVLAERYYYGFTIKELGELFAKGGFEVLEQYFSKKGIHIGVEDGENIVSITKKCKNVAQTFRSDWRSDVGSSPSDLKV